MPTDDDEKIIEIEREIQKLRIQRPCAETVEESNDSPEADNWSPDAGESDEPDGGQATTDG
jgi:hypothetical protein